MSMHLFKWLIMVLLLPFLGICSQEPVPTIARHQSEYQYAVAVVVPMKGQEVYGIFNFEQLPDGVLVKAHLFGLEPSSAHGVHIHQYGDLRDGIKGTKAGGHYNPEKKRHGLPPNKERHAGAFGNLVANADGEAKFEFLDHSISIAGVKNPVIGRSVVGHAKEDTGEQPAGNAGPRIGVGIIGVAKK